MLQILCGDVYLYLDSILTCDEKEVKKDAAQIAEVIESFFEMLQVWFTVVPSIVEYVPYMQKHPKLYLVCPEAAILNLYKSFEATLSLIFGFTPRSDDFMKMSSHTLQLNEIRCEPKVKKITLVRLILF